MLKNFFKVAVRNIVRHKGFSFINIAGLSLGLTACLLIGMFVRDEKEFDKSIPDSDRIYRVFYNITSKEGVSNVASTPPRFPTELQQHFPEVEQTARILGSQTKELFEAGDKKMYEEGGIFAEQSFFDMFPQSFIYGSPAGILSEQGSIVISSDMATRYFGTSDPVGKELKMRKAVFHVKGVFKPNPKFHLSIQYIIPLAATGLTKEQLDNWGWYGFHNYVKLRAGSDYKNLEAKFRKHAAPFLKDPNSVFLPSFQPLHKVHLYSAEFKYDKAVRGNITYVNALTIIAIFILLIACFNFVNLATAKSMQRAKEVGVRKTIGASRTNLIVQYISETIFLSFISIVISVALCYLLLPLLNEFTEKQIVFDLITNPVVVGFLIILTIVVGIIAGFYPALILSAFQPVKVLKGTTVEHFSGKTPWLRHGLVVIQFSLSVLLIISAIVVIRQVHYLHNKDLGFDKDQIMFFPMRGDNMDKNYESFKNELLKSPGISSVSIGYGFPGDMFGDGMMTVVDEGSKKTERATQLMVDHDYIKTLGLNLVAGRNFSKEIKTDVDAAFIINETAVKDLGLGTAETAIGKTLSWPTWKNPDSMKIGKVIGVVQDFHFKSLYDKLEPAVLQIYPDAYWKVAVKIKTSGIENAIAHVKNTWNQFTPDYPIEYNFLDESFTQMYKADDKLKSLLWIFTAITIFVACLGLFGLAAYAAERRRKEIGIRKVLGASVHGVIMLLSKDFIKLVFIALLIASPLAWYFMNKWLDEFAYRINISLWIFIAAGLVSIAIAMITVGFQAVKAALTNPVKNLRTE